MKRTLLTAALVGAATLAHAAGFMINANALGKASFTANYGRKK